MKIALIVIAAILVLLTLVIVVLAGTDIPAPSGRIEKTIPSDRFPK